MAGFSNSVDFRLINLLPLILNINTMPRQAGEFNAAEEDQVNNGIDYPLTHPELGKTMVYQSILSEMQDLLRTP
jgi:hypothetical protein